MRFSLPIHGISQDLELFLKGNFVAPRSCAQIHVNLFLGITRACPPQTRWFGYQVPSACFFNCGEVEDVVGALTPVGRGVAQVFHDLLVELRLMLVAEVEEGEEEDGQEESWEVESGEDLREERTLTWMTMVME